MQRNPEIETDLDEAEFIDLGEVSELTEGSGGPLPEASTPGKD
jgi:hypothetical protein